MTQILDDTGGLGVDVSLEMTGNQMAIDQAFAVLRKGGRFTAFGIPSQPITIDLNKDVIFKGITIYGINGRQLWRSWIQMQGLFRAGFDPSPIITHKIALNDFEKGFAMMMAPDRQASKIVMYP